MRPSLRLCAGVAVAAVLAVALPASASAHKVVLGPNLLPNASFEQSVVEPAPVPQYTTSQPLLPTGWDVEGVTGLFDHGQHGAHSGKRAAGISDPMTAPAKVCQQGSCVADPAAAGSAAAQQWFSETPSWRNANAVAVTAGKTYQVSAWVAWALQTVGTGASIRVRWVDASGMPVAIRPAAALIATARNSPALTWTKVTGLVRAPAGAKGAIVLFGDTDGGWISSLQYDDVAFTTYTVR